MASVASSFSAHGAPYWPWSTFFRKIAASEVFVILDSVPMTNSASYFNRCKLRNNGNEFYITVPIQRARPKSSRRMDVRLHSDERWKVEHRRTIEHLYGKSEFFRDVVELYNQIIFRRWEFLLDLNIELLRAIFQYCQLPTRIILLSELRLDEDDPTARLASIGEKLQLRTYICGEGSSNYLEEIVFSQRGISVEMIPRVPRSYPKKKGLWVDTGLSCLDELCHLGQNVKWRE